LDGGSPGGEVFPGPIERVPRVIALAPDGARCVAFPTIQSVRVDDPAVADCLFAVYLAPASEELWDIHDGLQLRYRPGFQRTSLPCELLWGPGTRERLLPDLIRYEDNDLSDRVEYLDRLFVVRVADDQIDDARSPEDFDACQQNDGEWHLLRADYPQDAFCHVRDHGDVAATGADEQPCRHCAVTMLGRFDDRASAAQGLRRLD